MDRRCCTNGTCGGGGVLLVINLGGLCRAEPLGTPVVGDCALALDEGGSARPEFPAGGAFFVTSGAGCRLSPMVGRYVPERPLLAETRLATRTGGADTGRPGNAALVVGLTVGCGMI
jgi:hypothetical protein